MKKTIVYSLLILFLSAFILSCASNKPKMQTRNGGKRINSTGSMGRGAK
jgi:hypothetical protein|tara:strand:+ start:27195 stop:27341 length:147 start_codon:yes stop_codon:yes gene_type:complete